VSDREGWSPFEDPPEDPDAAFIDALLGPRREPREMTPEQSERLDRRFHAMVEEQRRAWALRQRRRRAIAGAVVAVAVVGAGAGLWMGRLLPAAADVSGAPAAIKARLPVSETGAAPAPRERRR
jgi:hypothetical protein